MEKETLFARVALVVGIVLMLGLPWLLTRSWGWGSFDAGTGVVGDTIGGITAPISGLLGAYLVFLALKAQVKANLIVQDQIDQQKTDNLRRRNVDHIMILISSIESRIRDFTFYYNPPGKDKDIIEYKGSTAIRKMLINLSYNDQHEEDYVEDNGYVEFASIINLFDNILSLMESYDIDFNEKKYLTEVIYRQYEYGILGHVTQVEGVISICDECGAEHGRLPISLIKHIKDLDSRLNRIKK